MNDLGPIKSIIKSTNVTSMKNGRMRIRNLVTKSNLPMVATATATAATAATEERTKERSKDGEYHYVPPAAKRFYLCKYSF